MSKRNYFTRMFSKRRNYYSLGRSVRQQQGELWFVEEEISDSNAERPGILRERHTMVGGKISGSVGAGE